VPHLALSGVHKRHIKGWQMCRLQNDKHKHIYVNIILRLLFDI